MKGKLLIFCLAIFLCIQKSSAQSNEFLLDYNFTYYGRNMSFGYARHFKNHAIFMGIKYHANEAFDEDDKNRRFYKAGKSYKTIQNLGGNLRYTYSFDIKKENLVPFVFYDAMLAYLGIHDYSLYFTGEYVTFYDSFTNQSAEFKLYNSVRTFEPPSFSIEQNIGVGMKYRLYKGLYLNQSVGVGLNTYFHKPYNTPAYNTDGNVNFSLGYLLRLGLSYRF